MTLVNRLSIVPKGHHRPAETFSPPPAPEDPPPTKAALRLAHAPQSTPSDDGARHLPLAERPRTRGECIDGPRPCPWLGCRHHLLLEHIGSSGYLYASKGAPGPRRSLDRWTDDELAGALLAMPHTCSLDAASEGARLIDVGALLGVTRERVRQIQNAALARLSKPLEGYR